MLISRGLEPYFLHDGSLFAVRDAQAGPPLASQACKVYFGQERYMLKGESSSSTFELSCPLRQAA